MYRGNIALGQTIDVKFTTRAFASGAPTTLSGSPVISAYVGNGTTEITAGITLTVDFDSRTGLNNVRVVASGGNGFAAGTDVQLVITAGTVGGTSVVGEVVAEFSIENRTITNTATQTLGALTISGAFTVTGATVMTGNVSMAAGLTITQSSANTSAVAITGNGTGHGIAVTSGSGATGNGINSVSASTNGNGVNLLGTGTGNGVLTTGGAGAGGDGLEAVAGGGTDIRAVTITGTLATVTVATTATSLTNAPTVGDFTAAMKTSLNNATPVVTLAAAAIQAIWDALTTALTTAGSIGKLLVDNVNATISSRSTLTQAQILSDATPFAGVNIDAAVSTRSTPAQVKTQMTDALNVDTYAQPGQATPAATTTIRLMLAYLYKGFRNRTDQTASQYSLFNDDAITVDQKATFSDDGTTASRGEIATGP